MVLLITILCFYPIDSVLFMDETGFYERQNYARSWSPVGKPCYAKIDANKGKRLNLIGAITLSEFKLIAPRIFTGNCKRDLVESWLYQLGCTLSKDENGVYPKRFLVMDNARFHHGGKLKEVADKYNITLIYLPPYSPELNPIELFWAVLKQKVRLLIQEFTSLNDCVESCLF